MTKLLPFCLVIGLVTASGCAREQGPAPESTETDQKPAATETAAEPTVDEQIQTLDQMCADASEAMEARQEAQSLYDRAGGRDGIGQVVQETVRLHLENEQIVRLFDDVDAEKLIQLVTDFLVVATGGEGEYTGRDMVAAHADLNLTNDDFLAAGGDLNKAMQTAGLGDDESQEILCAFVGLRADVVTQ
ncbi:MAG: group I truncated hemoglobin [Planctomycetota bacterium]|jgi:hemoglobin